ncbi:hypothetical protein BASA61_007616 [Batrachochytrium salamandrivorans]|nr:hypothetical protein BASA61_007616 [Batrachochytrium salamandrivorans]
MFGVPLILVLALVSSSTVVAQPGENGFAEIIACFRRRPTSKASTKTVYEWIQPSKETSTSTSVEDSADIGLSYILQKLNLRSNEFKVMKNFTDRFGVTHVYGVPLYLRFPIGNLYAAVHVTNGQVFFYSAIIMDNPRLTKRSPTIPESTVKKSSEKAVNAAVDCLKVPFHNAIAPVKESYKTDNGKILVWVFHLRDNPTTQWIEVKVDANTGDIVSSQDFKRGFTYTAIKLPNENARGGVSEILSPENIQSSLYGCTEGYKTIGNNVRAKSGVLDLHIYTATEPNRDPALDNNVMIHELTHGLSTRLTGGAHEDMCMSKIESGGLGEGYSDMVALIFTAKPEDTRNTKKVIGTLMIQPCNPTFKSARDAMLAADDVYYGGIHEHLIRQGFAKRGLGSIS